MCKNDIEAYYKVTYNIVIITLVCRFSCFVSVYFLVKSFIHLCL